MTKEEELLWSEDARSLAVALLPFVPTERLIPLAAQHADALAEERKKRFPQPIFLADRRTDPL
jgi:hypothetical protein